ncbi:MAG: dipicolinate synthase subunit B, partial [Firmicutes bacterium]|nr:dipicolinate synthase subunit B [Bacillota bacterium]
MRLKGLRIGFALTGSHCTLGEVVGEVRRLLSEGAEVIPVISPSVDTTDTR